MSPLLSWRLDGWLPHPAGVLSFPFWVWVTVNVMSWGYMIGAARTVIRRGLGA